MYNYACLFEMAPSIITAFTYVILVCSVNSIPFYSKTDNASDLGHTDDNYAVLQLPVYLVYNNQQYSTLAVCNNGMISLQVKRKQLFPQCLVPDAPTLYHGQALIGPYISDVDTRSSASGKVYYELSTSPSLLARASGNIALAYRDENFVPTLLIIATYDHVGYYKNMSDKLDTYQVVLATDGVTSYALFLYNEIQWTTWYSRPGKVRTAQVGFYKEDGTVYFPLSSFANLTALPQTSNVYIPGLYVYRIDGADISPGPASILYPYGVVAGDASLPPADESSALVTLLQSVNLYGSSISSVYVNTNGFISAANLGGSASNPTGFPTSNGLFIAPFWADVDTTCAGTVFYRETNSPALLKRALTEIQRGYAAVGFSPARLLIVTWSQVGYYNCHSDKTNTFQAIIASGGGTSYVLFIYDTMQWMNGDSSGVGQMGISAGDGTSYFSLYGSGTRSILTLPIQSNVAKSGLFVLAGTAKLYPFGISQSDTVGVPGVSRSVTFSFPHHNLVSTFCYVYKAGYVSFNNVFGSYKVFSLKDRASLTDVVIAPYWSDAEGTYYYRTTTSEPLLQRVSAEIGPLFGVKFKPTSLLIATWNKMAYASKAAVYDGRINTFQAVVATNGSTSYLTYLYDTLQWYHSDYSVTYSPQVGYAIDGTVLTIPQSGSSAALSLTSLTNSHVPGMFTYAVPASPLARFRGWLPHRKGHAKGRQHIYHTFRGAKSRVVEKEEGSEGQDRKGVATSLKPKPFHTRKLKAANKKAMVALP